MNLDFVHKNSEIVAAFAIVACFSDFSGGGKSLRLNTSPQQLSRR